MRTFLLVYSALQSNCSRWETTGLRPSRTAAASVKVRSGGEWLTYFRANAARTRTVPWQSAHTATAAELAAIGPSLRAWQLGETSDGNHLRAAAACYSGWIEDPEYLTAVELFIREEQRHGALLGKFLDLAGVERTKSDWGDSLFRGARYFLTNMEVWTTPVVMVETLALVYYNAIRRATSSDALSEICDQILRDEVPHLQFACERLATLHRYRGRFALLLTLLAHRPLFTLVAAFVWVGHRRALRAGGYGLRRYWRAAWDRMNASWRKMDPLRYHWPERGDARPLAKVDSPGASIATAAQGY